MTHSPSSRLRAISLCFVCIAVLCVGQLFRLQVVRGAEYAEEADHQYVRASENSFSRGTIYFKERTGKLVAAATLRPSFAIVANPKKILDPEALYASTSPVLVGLEKDAFIAQLAKPNDTYEVLAPDVDQKKADAIRDLDLPGIDVYKQKKRLYPGNTLAAHVLGFVGWGKDGSTQVFSGRYGLERYYDDILTRSTGSLYVNFFAAVFAGLSSLTEKQNSIEGDIVTTIEPNVQATLERQLTDTKKQWDAEQIGGVVMDPQTGKIFAMAALPNYDPNQFNTVEDPSLFTNPMTENVYEMGSIVKPLTMAAAIDAGAVTAKTMYVDEGTVQVEKAVISNYDGKARGKVSMQEVLNQSLNTGMVFVMKSMGRTLFSEYMRNYALGEKTGIDLPNEIAGLIKNLSSPRDVEHATASFGQGIALTPLGVTRALASLGNGGYLVQPYMTDSIAYTLGITDTTKVVPGKRILKAETSKTITAMLVKVVDTALIGGKAKMEHYAIAAKTGTAQISKPGGGYHDDRFSHTFFGYFPASNPRFIVVLYMVHPKGARYASETLTKPFMDMTKFLLNYYQVPPDR